MTFSPPTRLSSIRPCPQCLLRFPGRLAPLLLGLHSLEPSVVRAFSLTPPCLCQRLNVAPLRWLRDLLMVFLNEDILAEVVAQVQRSSLISSNLAVSRSLSRGRSRPSSSSPLVDPHLSGPPRGGWPYGKRSSSSRSRGRKRFRGGKGSAPSSKPSDFQK